MSNNNLIYKIKLNNKLIKAFNKIRTMIIKISKLIN